MAQTPRTSFITCEKLELNLIFGRKGIIVSTYYLQGGMESEYMFPFFRPFHQKEQHPVEEQTLEINDIVK